jgi:glycosyltransferase involved in cell wall biosynthesis
MPFPEIVFDLTRLQNRAGDSTPTGIDRVLLEYAHWLACRQAIALRFVEVWRGRVLDSDPVRARQLISQTRSRWLTSAEGASEDRQRPVAGLSDVAARRLKVMSRALRSGAPARLDPGAVFVSIGHYGLERTELFRAIQAEGGKSTVFVHDLIPITNPQYCRLGECERHTRRIENTLREADLIIVNSVTTQEGLAVFAEANRLAMPATVVAPLGLDHCAGRWAPPANVKRPYFLFVGTIEPRKNLLLLAQVWRGLVSELGADVPRLIVAGRRGWLFEDTVTALHDPSLAGSIEEVADLSDRDLFGLMAGAAATLCPSHAEGFDLPFAEALAISGRVIASDIAVHRELAPRGLSLLPPEDAASWRAAILAACRPAPARLAPVWTAPTWSGHFDRVWPLIEALSVEGRAR